MKEQLLNKIKQFSELEYLYVLGLNYDVKQLQSYLRELVGEPEMSELYVLGQSTAKKYLMGTEKGIKRAKVIYNRWLRKEDSIERIQFLSGWNDKILIYKS